MGKFTNKILAEFQPPSKWKLGRDLVYTTTDLYANEVKALKDVGVAVVRDTNKTETITVPSGFITDLASTPRILWNVIAPFDVARAAVVHDILYEKINTQYKTVNESAAAEDGPATKKEREVYREIADHVFLEGMNASTPPVASWKKYAAYYAVRAFGRWAINSSAKRVA
mgnify:CR=1 FL=1